MVLERVVENLMSRVSFPVVGTSRFFLVAGNLVGMVRWCRMVAFVFWGYRFRDP